MQGKYPSWPELLEQPHPHATERVELTDVEAADLLRLLALYVDAYAEKPAELTVHELAQDLLTSCTDPAFIFAPGEVGKLLALLTPPEPTPEPAPEPEPELHPDYLRPRGIPLRACEHAGPVRVVSGRPGEADYLCASCGLEVVYLWAFENAGEWHHAAPTGLLELGDELSAGQCSSCGSFDPDTNEPGRGFELLRRGRRIAAVCVCCGDERRLELRPHPEVIL